MVKLNNDTDEQKEYIKKQQAADKIMSFLEIPLDPWGRINTVDLYEILVDDEKCQQLISKLRNKALW